MPSTGRIPEGFRNNPATLPNVLEQWQTAKINIGTSSAFYGRPAKLPRRVVPAGQTAREATLADPDEVWGFFSGGEARTYYIGQFGTEATVVEVVNGRVVGTEVAREVSKFRKGVLIGS